MEYDDLKRVVQGDGDVRAGMSKLLAICAGDRPHRLWEDIGRLDFEGGVVALRDWLAGRLPIRADVEVLWFAMWDVTEGFTLRGSSSWSRDPEDWDWWYRDDYDGGDASSPVLVQMLALALAAESPDAEAAPDDGLYGPVDYWLSLGYASLAARAALGGLDPAAVLGGRDELWVVSGHPDEVYGMILGRITATGFEPYDEG